MIIGEPLREYDVEPLEEIVPGVTPDSHPFQPEPTPDDVEVPA